MLAEANMDAENMYAVSDVLVSEFIHVYSYCGAGESTGVNYLLPIWL